MPHPVARPVAGTRPRPARGMRRSRRRWPAFLLLVAVASATVFGVYQVFGGSQDPAGNPRGTAAVGAPPHANATSGSKSTPKPKQASHEPAEADPEEGSSDLGDAEAEAGGDAEEGHDVEAGGRDAEAGDEAEDDFEAEDEHEAEDELEARRRRGDTEADSACRDPSVCMGSG